MISLRKLIFSLILLTAFAQAEQQMQTCPGCQCPADSLPLEEAFKMPKQDKSQSFLSCLEVTDKLLNPALCMLRFNLTPEISGACQSVQVKDKCPELSGIYPLTYTAAEAAPANCGYNWKGFNYEGFFKVVDSFKEDGQIKCEASMCTSATFLAWVAVCKELYQQKKITEEQFNEMTLPGGKAYRILNGSAEPNQLVEKFNIGTGHIQYIEDQELGMGGVPKQGDLVQIWRKSGSGHSVVFKGLVDKDNDGKVDHLCYWSSQSNTKGYANNCESIETMDRILIGSFDV